MTVYDLFIYFLKENIISTYTWYDIVLYMIKYRPIHFLKYVMTLTLYILQYRPMDFLGDDTDRYIFLPPDGILYSNLSGYY